MIKIVARDIQIRLPELTDDIDPLIISVGVDKPIEVEADTAETALTHLCAQIRAKAKAKLGHYLDESHQKLKKATRDAEYERAALKLLEE